MKMNLNELRDMAYQTAVQHGFHEEEHDIKHYLMLVITEVAEMVEADRKGRKANPDAFHRGEHNNEPFERNFEDCIKNTLQDEMADVVIRLLDMAGALGMELNACETVSFANVIRKRTFMDNAFYCCKILCQAKEETRSYINYLIKYMYDWADKLNVDLEWHVAQKMKYNETRPFRNGKKY